MSSPPARGPIPLADGHIDLTRRHVCRGTTVAVLTPTEHDLLVRLLRDPGSLVSRADLLVDVWGYHPKVRSRAVYTAVQRLRAKVEVDPKSPVHLRSVYGGGYCFEPAVPAVSPEPAVDLALPPEPCRWFGRQALVDQVIGRLSTPGRTTLLGPGGMGKSRLALHVAHRAVATGAQPPAAFAFADVEHATDLGAAVRSVLQAVDEGWPDGGTVDTALRLVRWGLAARRVLVLDGMEPLVASIDGEALSRLFASLPPHLHILMTSRIPVVSDETALHLTPLGAEAGLALLEDRARRVTWGLQLSEAERLQARRLVTDQLDGMPLAIELAAARLGVLGLDRLCSDLRAPTLADPRRHRPRHASLAAAAAWSLALLSEPARRLLGRLSAVVGAIDTDGATVLSDGSEEDVIAAIMELRDTSLVLVVPVADGPPRVRLLAPIRELVAARLEPAERRAAALAHLAWCAERAADLAPRVGSSSARTVHAELAHIEPDLRVAFHTAVEHDHPGLSALALHLDVLTAHRAPLPERLARLSLALAAPVVASERAQLWIARACIHCKQHAWPAARADLAAARLDDPDAPRLAYVGARIAMFTGQVEQVDPLLAGADDTPEVLRLRAYACQVRGDHDRAQRLGEAALAALRDLDDLHGACSTANNLALLFGEQGRFEAALQLLDEALAAADELDHSLLRATTFQNRGSIRLRTLDLARARPDLERALELAERLGIVDRAFVAELCLAELQWEAGDLPGARARFATLSERPVAAPIRLFAEALLGAADHEQGDLDAAKAALTRAWTAAAGLPDRRIFVCILLAPCLAECGDVDRAEAVLDELDALLEEAGDPEGRALARMGRIHLAEARGEPAPALPVVHPTLLVQRSRRMLAVVRGRR